MGNISIIASIADDRQKAKEIANRVQNRREQGDTKTFEDILQEEIDKLNEKATKDTDQDSPR